jgi:hypothetical protein
MVKLFENDPSFSKAWGHRTTCLLYDLAALHGYRYKDKHTAADALWGSEKLDQAIMQRLPLLILSSEHRIRSKFMRRI